MTGFVDADGVALRYDVVGEAQGEDARTIVLVHEMGGSLESWDLVLPALAEGGRRVLRYDTRGAGLSEKVRGALHIDTMANDLRALLDALRIGGPVSLAGVAVGAAIAIRFAALYPERTAALVAMGPATGVSGDRRAATLARADQIEKGGMRAVEAASLSASYPPVVRYDEARFQAFRARWLGNDPDSLAAINRMLANTEMQDDLPRLRCPTLILAGIHDPLRPPSVVEPLAKLVPGARFQALETGHFMTVQTPEIVAAAMTAFLAEVGC